MNQTSVFLKLKTSVRELKPSWKIVINHHAVICPPDREKMYTSIHMSVVTPADLDEKDQFHIRLFLCRRGCENIENNDEINLYSNNRPKHNS